MYNLMIVGTEVCKHTYNPILEHFYHPKKQKEKQDPLAITPHSHTQP